MAAGVEIKHGQPQQLGTVHLVEKSRTALGKGLLVGRAEIDKVAVVRQHILGFKAAFTQQGLEAVDFLLRQRLAHPAALVAGEEGESRGTDGLGVENGVSHASRRTDMGSDVFIRHSTSYFNNSECKNTKKNNKQELFNEFVITLMC